MPRPKPTREIFIVDGQRSRVSLVAVRRWVRSAAATLRLPAGAITVIFATPTVSQVWNTRYRRKPKPTNILSFRYDPPADGLIGELIVCPMIVRREAPGRAYAGRMKFLLEHGCIHLLGLDHQSAAEIQRWEKLERQISL